jgi:hypothetical protein
MIFSKQGHKLIAALKKSIPCGGCLFCCVTSINSLHGRCKIAVAESFTDIPTHHLITSPTLQPFFVA